MKEWTARAHRKQWILAIVLALTATRSVSAEPETGPKLGGSTLSTRLDNGLEVVLSQARQQPIFSMAVRYRVGSRDDPPNLDELAHLVEHLSFRRSEHFAHDGGLQITNLSGVSDNASTSADDTTYVSRGPVRALPRVLWLERQRMAFALGSLSSEDIVRERKILENERSTMRADRVGGMFWRLVAAELYPPEHPYAPRPERGCILHCELRHAQWLMQRGYRPDNARLVVVGDFEVEAVLDSVRKLFGSIGNPGVSLPRVADVAPRSGHREMTIAAPVSRSLVHLCWHVPGPMRAQRRALRVLSSELWLLLSGDLVDGVGLASAVDVRIEQRELGWLWSVRIDLHPGVDPKLVERRALAQLARLRRETLPIEFARESLVKHMFEVWEDLDARAELLAKSEFGFDIELAKSEQSRVSGEDVRRLAAQLLTAGPALSVYVRRAVDAPLQGTRYEEPR